MKSLIFISLIFLSSLVSYSQVAINKDGSTPDASAMLDVKSTTQGMLIPRMSTVERTGVASPAVGLMVFDNDTESFWYYKTTGWMELVTGSGGGGYWSANGSNIFNNNAGNVGIGVNIPLAPLHIKNDNEAVRIQGTTPYISFYDNAGTVKGFVQNYNNNMLFGTPASNPNSKLEFYNSNVKNMTLDGSGVMGLSGSLPSLELYDDGIRSGYVYGYGTNLEVAAFKSGSAGSVGNLILQTNEAGFGGTIYAGNVGIGVTDPAYKLDIKNRIRLRSGSAGESAGIWLNNLANTSRIAFMGIADDVTTGFYGNVSGWGLIMNTNTGNVGIGTLNPTYKLSVNGDVRTKEIVVETGWSDYVFDKNYKLNSLEEVEKFIQKNKHLPNIPSAKEVEEKGLRVGDVQKRMMEKIEELTLYIIEANKKIEKLEQLIKGEK